MMRNRPPIARQLQLLLLFVICCAVVTTEAQSFSINNSRVRVDITITNGVLLETYLVYSDISSSWVPQLTYTGPSDAVNCEAFRISTNKIEIGVYLRAQSEPLTYTWTAVSLNKTDAIQLIGKESGGTGSSSTVRNISVHSNAAEISHVLVSDSTTSANASRSVTQIEDWYTYVPTEVDYIYSPAMKITEDDVVAHWAFKSPVILLQSGSAAASIVPNLDSYTKESILSQPMYLDVTNDGVNPSALAYGAGNTVLSFHSLYSHDSSAPLSWTTVSLNYSLVLFADQQPLRAYQNASQWLWQKFGRPRLLAGAAAQQNYKNPNMALFDDWRRDTWLRYAQQIYFSFPCGSTSQTCGSLPSYRTQFSERLGTNMDLWANAWFQTLRTAHGMFLYSLKTANQSLQAQAQSIMRTHLQAPKSPFGPTPMVFWLSTDNRTMNWVDGDGWAGMCSVIPANLSVGYSQCLNYYNLLSTSWTGYWMLRWVSELEPALSSQVLPVLTNYGEYLVKAQQETGVIPAYVSSEDGSIPYFLSATNSETGGAALFLMKLWNATGQPEFLAAAQSALSYIATEILPSRKWWDYETFVSCSAKSYYTYDPWTRQYPENNLAKIITADAFLEAYRQTNDKSMLDLAQQVIDYMVLSQQVYSHPTLTPNLIGGFTTQNTDCEWSDARQGYSATVLLDAYKLTKRLDYLERGVAALRSSYAVAPYENWAHTGGSQGDEPGALTGIHWCQGSGTTSVELTVDWLRDAYIDVMYGHGVCVNGCSMDNLSIAFNQISFSLSTPFSWGGSPLNVAFENVPSRSPLEVIVNGASLGIFTADELLMGLAVPADVIASQ